jgi:CDP-4-dehydro-6-deoxyglucose reductase, E1
MSESQLTYRLAEDSWDENEINAIYKVIQSRNFTMGEITKEFERKFAAFFGSKYAVFSNSGSSANLLAIASLIYSNRISKGDEVIVPAVSWSTTYYPLQQYGLKLRFVDVDINTLNLKYEDVREAISDETRAIFCVNLLGNPCELSKLKDLCKERNIYLIEDNCESLGAKLNNKFTGSFGILGTFSTYFSHHISTIEGGVTITNDLSLYEIMISLRAHGWTRGLQKNSKLYTKSDNHFYEQFNFILPGYNLRPTEIQASIGLEQIKKIPSIVKQRRKNAMYFIEKIKNLKNYIFQKEHGESSWFGFSIILDGNLIGKRDYVVDRLTAKGIECRPIVAGNFVLNPVIKYIDYSVYKELKNANMIHNNGLFVGNHSVDNRSKIDSLIEILREIHDEQ